MSELNTFITQTLAPALAISATGMLTLGMQNRLSVLASRVRELNREIIAEVIPDRTENLRQQVALFIQRGTLIRNALFLLYASIGLLIVTAFALALTDLEILRTEWRVPVITFLLGLGLILIAILIEVYEVLLMLKTLHLDVESVAISLDVPKLPD